MGRHVAAVTKLARVAQPAAIDTREGGGSVQDLVVIVDDVPGELRRLTHTLGNAGINIEGMAALTGQGTSVIHILVSEPERALMALAAAQLEARAVHDAVVVNLADRPDALASCLEPLAHAGVNISLAYVAVGARSQTRVVLVTDDPAETQRLLADVGG